MLKLLSKAIIGLLFLSDVAVADEDETNID